MKNSILLALLTLGSSLACAGTTQAPKAQLASASSCQQLDGAAQTVQELYSPGNIYAAKPFKKKVFRSRAYQPVKTFGASLYTRAEKGMSGPYMERVLRCHAAFGRAAHPNDPLHPAAGRITDLSVDSVNGSFAIRIESDSIKTGGEIWQRAQSLSGATTSVTAEQVGALNSEQGEL